MIIDSPIVTGSLAIAGSVNVTGSLTVTGNVTAPNLQTIGEIVAITTGYSNLF